MTETSEKVAVEQRHREAAENQAVELLRDLIGPNYSATTLRVATDHLLSFYRGRLRTPEPVAFLWQHPNGDRFARVTITEGEPRQKWLEEGFVETPLYAHPPTGVERAQPTDHMVDMANVGEALMEAIRDYSSAEFMKTWAPADCPSEIVGDLLNALEEALSASPSAESGDEWGCDYCRNDGKLNEMDCCPKCGAQYETDATLSTVAEQGEGEKP